MQRGMSASHVGVGSSKEERQQDRIEMTELAKRTLEGFTDVIVKDE